MGLFGRSRPQESQPTDDSLAVDALASALRTVGRQAFDTPTFSAAELSRLAEAWACHVLTGVPADPEAGLNRDDAGNATRRYPGVKAFFDKALKAARELAEGRRDQLRRVVWDCVQGFRRLLKTEAESDAQISALLDELERAMRAGSMETVSVLVPRVVATIKETMGRRQERLSGELSNLSAQLEALKEEVVETRELAEKDALTGLFNRRALDSQLRELDRMAAPVAFLILDLDHFKKVNDTYGHPAGDEVLRRLADCLVRNFPRKNDFMARFGGEEFAVLLAGVDREGAERLVERLLKNVRAMTIPFEGQVLRVTASVGYAIRERGEGPEALISRADRALYSAKRHRDCAVLG